MRLFTAIKQVYDTLLHKILKMKKLLIISFDIRNTNEPKESYAVASISSYLKSKKEHKKEYLFDHISVNISETKEHLKAEINEKYFRKMNFDIYNYIAISVYVWSANYTSKIVKYIKDKKYCGKIILGGNEISYSTNEELKKEYPFADIYIRGFAEESLYKILVGKARVQTFINENVFPKQLCQVYKSKEINTETNNIKVRLETKRGCLFNCSFCAHKEKGNKYVNELDYKKVIDELLFLNKQNISKVNILDPIFNTGNYLDILEAMVEMNFKPRVSIQTRFELIHGKKGKQFLDLCVRLDITLEFGLQTIIEEEYKIIKRNNNIEKIKKVLFELQERDIDYEVSLIYGLPNQTVHSFIQSIEFLRKNGSRKIIAFPLMLLRGTELFHHRHKWNLKEKVIGEYNLPYVVSANSFNENDYKQMEQISNNLKEGTYEKSIFIDRGTRKWKDLNGKKSIVKNTKSQPLFYW